MENLWLSELEMLRTEMHGLGIEKGLTHPEVLAISQRIDSIHNKLLEHNKDFNDRYQKKTGAPLDEKKPLLERLKEKKEDYFSSTYYQKLVMYHYAFFYLLELNRFRGFKYKV